MARNFTIPYSPATMAILSSGFAGFTSLPSTGRRCYAFDDAADEAVILEGVVPIHYTGSGTLKLRLLGCANTTTAADDVRIDVVTEFLTAGAAESANSAAFDSTPDSGTFTFSTTAYSVQEITITLTPATTPAVGDLFRIKVSRDADESTSGATGLDSLSGDFYLLFAEFFEEV